MLNYAVLLALPFLFLGCQVDQGNHLEEYYFPVGKLDIPAVYTYKSVQDTFQEDVIWQYAVERQDGKTILRGVNLDRLGRPVQVNEEEITGSGALLRSLSLVAYDSLGQAGRIDAWIEGNNVFPFQVRDSSLVYFYKVTWEQPMDSLEVALTRNRRYMGPTTCRIGGKDYPGVRFLVRELLTTDREGMTKSQWSGEEIYAKGVGLAYYRKEISPEYILEYSLISDPFQEK